MYLSRLKLDVSNRRTMQALVAPNLFHGAVESAFSGERKRNLWRIDTLNGETYLMILSEDKPDLSNVAEQFALPEAQGETLPYEKLLDRIAIGGRWRFRLVANPTVKTVIKDDDEDTTPNQQRERKVLAHITSKFQKEWLMKKSEHLGFELDEEEFQVTGSRWYRFRKKKDEKAYVSLLAVTFEGVLMVKDAEQFKQTLCNGIGREKAFGMGLLTVVRA